MSSNIHSKENLRLFITSVTRRSESPLCLRKVSTDPALNVNHLNFDHSLTFFEDATFVVIGVHASKSRETQPLGSSQKLTSVHPARIPNQSTALFNLFISTAGHLGRGIGLLTQISRWKGSRLFCTGTRSLFLNFSYVSGPQGHRATSKMSPGPDPPPEGASTWSLLPSSIFESLI